VSGTTCTACVSESVTPACLPTGVCGCEVAADCASALLGQACLSSGVCGCTSDADCAPGVTCNTTTSACNVEIFAYTGANQSFVVPTGVTQVIITAAGASSPRHGTGVGSEGAPGGTTTATLSVTPSEALTIVVGGTAGFNGGGAAPGSAQGGAGASDVRQGGSGLGDRVVVAGGGGGDGNVSWSGCHLGCHSYGGYGGGTVGGAGVAEPGGTGGWAGGGGTQTAGGAAGASSDGGVSGGAGSSGAGGDGTCTGLLTNCGGGGGGGYYGGGGGAAGAGGGGGSGYATPSATAVTMTSGTWPGDGQVTIAW